MGIFADQVYRMLCAFSATHKVTKPAIVMSRGFAEGLLNELASESRSSHARWAAVGAMLGIESTEAVLTVPADIALAGDVSFLGEPVFLACGPGAVDVEIVGRCPACSLPIGVFDRGGFWWDDRGLEFISHEACATPRGFTDEEQ